MTVDPNPPGQTGHLALTTAFAYDDAGRLVAETNPRGFTTSYGYDDADRLMAVTDALGGVVGFGRDAAGQVLTVTNPRGKVTTYAYDALGNVLTETNPLARTRSTTYDLLGRPEVATDARGYTVAYGHDARGDLTSIVAKDAAGATVETVGLTYDALRRLTGLSDATGASGWSYDAAGRVTQVASPQGAIGYGYDAADRRTSMTLPGSRATTYGYDAAGRLTSVGDWLNGTTTLGYDADGRRTDVLRPNGVSTAYQYDGAGRLSLVEHAAGQTMLQRFVYALDANGNRTAVTHNGGTESYTLDALDRITRATYADGQVVDYAYDPAGNRTTQEVNGVAVATYEYDDADQLLSDGSIAYLHDANGNLTQAGADAFAWDWADRLTGVTAGGQTTTYAYAGDGVRATKTAGGQTTSYLWDRADPGGLPLLVDDGTQAYLHAGEVLQGVEAATGDVTYLLADGLGSIRGRTDASGALVGTADYDAFGTVRASSGVAGTFGFAGEQRDAETGLVHLRARDYAPGLGRFLSRDPVVPSAAGTQGWQPYAYAGNNPTTNVDPGGAAYELHGEMRGELIGGALVSLAFAGVLAGSGPAPLAIPAFSSFAFAMLALILLVLAATAAVQIFCAVSGRCEGASGTIEGWMEGLIDVGRGLVAIGVGVLLGACAGAFAGAADPSGLGPLPAIRIANACPSPPEEANDCLTGAARGFTEEYVAGLHFATPGDPIGAIELAYAAYAGSTSGGNGSSSRSGKDANIRGQDRVRRVSEYLEENGWQVKPGPGKVTIRPWGSTDIDLEGVDASGNRVVIEVGGKKSGPKFGEQIRIVYAYAQKQGATAYFYYDPAVTDQATINTAIKVLGGPQYVVPIPT